MDTRNFVRRQFGRISLYSCAPFEEVAGLFHGFSTRHGGVSPLPVDALNLSHLAWDKPNLVSENRLRFTSPLGLHPSQLFTMSQIHSDRVHIIEDNHIEWNRPQADAVLTRLRGVALTVQVADCFPVLIADPNTGAIAAVHAGWRGTLARIVEKSIMRITKLFGSNTSEILVAIGPAIRSCCFEVGPEVASEFYREYASIDLMIPQPGRPGKFLLDLRKALDAQFAHCNVPLDHVYDLGACTFCGSDEFFSYRRDGARSGRMMAVIGWRAS